MLVNGEYQVAAIERYGICFSNCARGIGYVYEDHTAAIGKYFAEVGATFGNECRYLSIIAVSNSESSGIAAVVIGECHDLTLWLGGC